MHRARTTPPGDAGCALPRTLLRALLAGALIVASLLDSACEVGQGPLRVRKVIIDVAPDAERLGREHVRAVLHASLRALRGVHIVDDGRHGGPRDGPGEGAVLRVRLESFGATLDEGQPPKTTLALSVEVVGLPGEGPADFRGQAVASASGVADTRTLVEVALRDAMAQVLLSRAAADLESTELIAWLERDGTSTDQRRRAVRVLGGRRESAAVDVLARVLLGEDRELQPLALTALASIGDAGGVDAVLAYADRKPPTVVRQSIEAVRLMGSRRGKAWLFTLSTGHAEPDVQRHAASALAWVESQERSAAAGPASSPGALAETAPSPGEQAVR